MPRRRAFSLPSEAQLLALLQERAPQAASLQQLAAHFQVPEAAQPALRRRLHDLVRRGRVQLREGRYFLPPRPQTLVGVVQRHEDGYGFFVPDDRTQADVYLPRHAMRGVLHGDRVRVRVETGRDGRRRGRVVQVLARGQSDVIGTVRYAGRRYWLVPLEPHRCPQVALPARTRQEAKPGQLAVVELTGFRGAQPQGRLRELLGEAGDPGMALALVLRKYDLPRAFPPEVEAEAEAVARPVDDEGRGRRDLRSLLTFTIDGETARDFDDAVSLEELPSGHYRLGVHIADVSHYVREDSALDREAFRRGTSVYFPDRVIPMLPDRLSSDLCSLRPASDRLTMSLLIELTPAGEPRGYELVDAVIHSRARLTYRQVAAYLEGDRRALAGTPAALGEVLARMAALAQRLRQRRLRAGSLDFDLPASDLVLDHEGNIERILRAERTAAHLLIEEFMLLANRTVAAHLARRRVPTLYRVHAPPEASKIAQFNAFVQALGYRVHTKAGAIRPRAVQAVLQQAQGKPEERLINHLLLRTLQRACYATENTGHFALAFPHYTHFTSPIRRYPDLVVHRLLREAARPRGMPAARRAFWAQRLPEIAAHASQRERLAEEAEREVVERKKVEFMRDKVGQAFTGVITGVTGFGLFVELEDLLVEGLVPLARLPGAFVHHPQRHCLLNPKTGQAYRLGDRLRVRLERVHRERGRLDFSLC
ncbi:MAG: ribonuclease R [Candidatus Tectimicrobiota bacterium]|nr:MAG: ribonuclease R [Candidatus Tectomicrobia bacterium]